MTTLQDLLDEAMGRPAYTAFTDRRPVPYRNDRAPRPLPRTMRPPEARANDPRLAWDEQSRALAELQRPQDLARMANEGQAQTLPDPYELDTPLKRGVLGVARAYGPGAAYDAMVAGARVANGDRGALGDLALNTGIAALPFLGVRGLRGEPAPVPMRETATPLPSQAWNTFGDLPPAEAPRPVAPDGGGAGALTWREQLRSDGFNVDQPFYHGTGNDVRGGLRPSEDAELNGVFLTPSPHTASFYSSIDRTGLTRSEGGNVVPVYVRGRVVDFDSPEIRSWRRRLDKWRTGPRPAGTTWPPPPPGIAGVRGAIGRAYWEPRTQLSPSDEEIVIFDPSNIRSQLGPWEEPSPVAPARGGAPPPTDPKSLPRRKPPSGGFTVFGAPR